MALDEFVMTIASDDEEDVPKNAKAKDDETQLNPDFTFDLQGDPYAEFLDEPSNAEDLVKTGSKPVRSSLLSAPHVVMTC